MQQAFGSDPILTVTARGIWNLGRNIQPLDRPGSLKENRNLDSHLRSGQHEQAQLTALLPRPRRHHRKFQFTNGRRQIGYKLNLPFDRIVESEVASGILKVEQDFTIIERFGEFDNLAQHPQKRRLIHKSAGDNDQTSAITLPAK